MKNVNWSINETRELFELCGAARAKGESLSEAFNVMSQKTGRSVNSVRNYYYGQARTFELVPEIADKLGIKAVSVKRDAFVPFTDKEIRSLVETVLINKAGGKSVRATIYELAGGDAKKALRLQNKYRSVLRSHRKEVESVMRELDERGVAFADPYARENRPDNFARLTEYIAALDESKVGTFLSLIEKLT